MVSEGFIEWLIEVANEKFDQNMKIINKLYSQHSELLKQYSE